MELLTWLTYKFLMGLCGSVVLPGNLGASIFERFTCRQAIIKTFKNFHLKKTVFNSLYHSLILKKYISRTVMFTSNCSKNSKIGFLKSKRKHLQNLVSTFPGKTSMLAVTDQVHSSLFLI